MFLNKSTLHQSHLIEFSAVDWLGVIREIYCAKGSEKNQTNM